MRCAEGNKSRHDYTTFDLESYRRGFRKNLRRILLFRSLLYVLQSGVDMVRYNVAADQDRPGSEGVYMKSGVHFGWSTMECRISVPWEAACKFALRKWEHHFLTRLLSLAQPIPITLYHVLGGLWFFCISDASDRVSIKGDRYLLTEDHKQIFSALNRYKHSDPHAQPGERRIFLPGDVCENMQ